MVISRYKIKFMNKLDFVSGNNSEQ